MQRITKNIFRGGLNTDSSPNQIDPIYFTDAHNLSLVSDGEFFDLKNIRGTTLVQDIINVASTEVLGVFETKYKIGATPDIKCLTIITATVSGNFKIWCYDTENDTLYGLYEEAVEAGYFTDDRVIDAVRHAENGIDILYFTDFFSEVRQLRCEIPSPNLLNENDLSLQRRGANGVVELDSISSGGSLLSGTYQFAYRMVDPDKKKFTKWSSLTNPIHVYATDAANFISYSGIGLPTTQKITIDVVPTDEELTNFPNFQLVVVENIYPTSDTESSLTASLLPVKLIAEVTGVEYKSNTKVGTIPIEDIVVDLAPIQTAKTINTKLNKLLLGNIKYRQLELDNGTPSISGGSITTVTSAPGTVYYNQSNSSSYRGYFRDEVYRFGIVYYDKYGNHSAPVALDLSSVSGNQISGALTDMKFPSRSTSNSYSILDSSDSPKVIGLSLTGIYHHPTWAVGFEIVRVKRIKRILFQTPVIPMAEVEGIGAFIRYPSLINTTNDDSDTKEYPDAQPMTSSKVLVPKNLFWPERRNITRRTTSSGGDGIFGGDTFNKTAKGESQLTRKAAYNYAAIFPDSTIYGGTPYVFSGNEKLQTIDFCITRLDKEEFSDAEAIAAPTGNHVNTKISGNFYALRQGDYFFDNGWVGKSISDADNQVADYAFIDNLSAGVILAGEKVLQYSELSTQGVPLGYEPTNQKMAVVKLTSDYTDEGSTSKTFANGTHNAYAGNGYVFGSSGIKFETASTNYSNTFVTKYSGFSENSSYVQALRIVNVINGGIGDDRYGDPEDQHEYISTGAKYSFSTLELVDVAAGNFLPITLSVYGGDCFIGYHTFKISDSTYSVVNQTKNNGSADTNANLRKFWDNILYSIPTSGVEPNPKICMPVALEKVGQFVQVFLESEYNGEVRDYDVLVKKTSISSTPILNVSSESSIRTPLTYKYNINLSKQNDQKVYLSKPENFVEQNDFEARIAISDQKIYNSDTQGFDVFRVLNFFDLEESGGHLTKLCIAGDNLYGIQERRVSYLPVGAAQIEQTNAGILSVGTGSDIGRPIMIDSNKGSQHIKGVVETGGVLYIPDNRNKAVYALSGQELRPISDLFNATLWRSKFATAIPENELLGIYDPIRKEYWLAGTNFCQRFNEVMNAWHGNYEFTNLLGGVATNQNLYLIGKVTNQISVFSAYTGDYNQLFGNSVVPRVTFVQNPDSDLSKVFDNVALIATDRLSEIDFTVEREDALGAQTGTIIVDVPPVEGNYRIKIMRDTDNARLRGTRMISTVKWLSGDFTSTLSSVLTKYRLSSRQPI
jgi:hypothetical protein